MCDIYRVFECHKGFILEIAFLSTKESVKRYL